MKTNKLFHILVVLAMLIAALPVMTAGAAGTVTVKASNVGVSWLVNDTRSGGASSFVMGPGTSPLGVGSLQMTTTDAFGTSNAKAQLFNYSHMGSQLSNLDGLSYWAYRSSASTNSAAQTISLNLEVDYVGDGTSYTTLVFEPIYQPGGVGAMMVDTWQQWDAFNGGNAIWWSTRAIPGVPQAFASYVTWDTIVSNNPDAKIRFGVGFNVGSGWAGQFSGAADSLLVSFAGDATTYDFEPTPPDTTGPVTSNVLASPNPAPVNGSITLTANVDDSTTGGSDIASAEYSLDGGTTWLPMAASDTAFDDVSEDVTVSFSASATPGIYDLCVRGTDAAGNVGAPECIMFVVYDPTGGFVTGGGWIDSPAGAVAPVENIVYFNGFETDINGWFTPTRVMSGTNGVVSASGSYHAEAIAGNYTRWGGYNSVFPAGGYITAVDVYLNLDAGFGNDTRFDWSSAINDTTGAHRRDFVFNGGFYNDTDGPGAGQNRFVFSASNNAPGWPKNPGRDPFAVTATGWYTLQHRFYDNGAGVLAVDLSILDSAGNVLHTWSLSDPSDVIGTTVGGNRYGWFVTNGFPFLAIDNSIRKEFSDITGKATFGFVSKYRRGATVPDGNTEFQFKAGNLNFSSTSYQWLVVNQAGTNAQFKGYGTINGAGNYGFMLWAGDGSPDTFRIKIWEAATEVVVYDNGTDQAIGGGSIVVHKR